MRAGPLGRAWRWLSSQRSRVEDWPYPTWPLSVALLVLLSLVAIWPLLQGDVILTGDTSHPARIHEMHRCLSDGQIPCRWVPDFGNGYGYPLFNYYPPLPYYAGTVLHWLGFSYIVSANLLAATGLIAAGLSMLALARRLWGELGGVVSAVAYMFAPYLALDIYMRGAIAELWALAVLPALFLLIYVVIDKMSYRLAPLLALAVAAVLLSHNLVAVIAAPALAVWAIIWLARDKKTAIRTGAWVAAGCIWGVGLAAFFTLPVLFEGDLVQLDNLSRFPFHYSGNFAPLNDLLFLRTADYSALLGVRQGTPIQIGWFHWGLALAAGVGALSYARADARPLARALAAFSATAVFAVCMSISLSEPAWDAFDRLRFVQFPWRYVGLISFATSALVGSILLTVQRWHPRARSLFAIALVGLFAGTGWTFFRPYHACDLADEALLGSANGGDFDPVCAKLGPAWDAGITDYLPKAVTDIPAATFAPLTVVNGDARLLSWQKGSDWLTLDVSSSMTSTVRASVFDFPEWEVRIDSERVPHRASDPHGLIEFEVLPGTHDVELRLYDTGVRSTANAISLVSWGGLLLTALLSILAWRRHDR